MQEEDDVARGKRIEQEATAEIGRLGGISAIKNNFPNAQLIFKGKNSNTFDLVFKNGDQVLIVEAKAGDEGKVKLGLKEIDGNIEEQGTRKYRVWMIENMCQSTDAEVKEMGCLLKNTSLGNLLYLYAETSLDEEGKLLDVTLRGFTL